MKKLLKMFFTLATTAVVPLTVVACGQQSLDGTLNAINTGQTNYSIDQVLDKNISNQTLTKITLTNNEAEQLAENVANTIISDASLPAIEWYQKNLAPDKKCYNFNVTNGTAQDNSKEWDVNNNSQRFNIKISYLSGYVSKDHIFKPSQRIDMSFNIKVGTGENDKKLANWINKFNEQSWKSKSNPIDVDLSKIKVDMPGSVSWNDLDSKIVSAANTAIEAAIENVQDPNWEERNVVAWSVDSSNGTIDTSNKILELVLKANCCDSYIGDGVAPAINNIYIKFIKES